MASSYSYNDLRHPLTQHSHHCLDSSSSTSTHRRRRPFNSTAGIFISSLFLVSLLFFTLRHVGLVPSSSSESQPNFNARKSESFVQPSTSRGASQGVSEKSSGLVVSDENIFPWTNAMLSWQKTGYHFQPEKNWMNGRVKYFFKKKVKLCISVSIASYPLFSTWKNKNVLHYWFDFFFFFNFLTADEHPWLQHFCSFLMGESGFSCFRS